MSNPKQWEALISRNKQIQMSNPKQSLKAHFTAPHKPTKKILKNKIKISLIKQASKSVNSRILWDLVENWGNEN